MPFMNKTTSLVFTVCSIQFFMEVILVFLIEGGRSNTRIQAYLWARALNDTDSSGTDVCNASA